MKYQLIKHNKSTSRVLGFYETLEQVKHIVSVLGLRFEGLSYMGGFPTFTDKTHKRYSIQGAVFFDTGNHIMCSLPQAEAESFQ